MTKTRDGYEKGRRGRRAGDPAAQRSYRYVMRMHPDLADVLSHLSDEAGLSRAMFVERILISFVNQDPRYNLDIVGRHPSGPRPSSQLGSLSSFGDQWRRYDALRADVLGPYAEPRSPLDDKVSIDEHGRDGATGMPVGGAHGRVPDRLRPSFVADQQERAKAEAEAARRRRGPHKRKK